MRGVAVRGEVLVQRDEVLALEGSSRDGVGERLGQEDLRRLNSKQKYNEQNCVEQNKCETSGVGEAESERRRGERTRQRTRRSARAQLAAGNDQTHDLRKHDAVK